MKQGKPFAMFAIENSKDKLNLLIADYNILKQNPLNISLAEKGCTDAWHISDWVYEELKQNNGQLTKRNFRDSLFRDCPEMRILHDIANKIKHKTLDRPKTKITKTDIHQGEFSPEHTKEFNVSRLVVYYNDTQQIDVDDLIKIAIDYWTSVITD